MSGCDPNTDGQAPEDRRTPTVSRRHLLATAGVASVGLLAGCSGGSKSEDGGDGGEGSESGSESGGSGSRDGSGSGTGGHDNGGGSNGGGSASCGTPPEDLTAALPPGEEFEPQGNPRPIDQNRESITAGYQANYVVDGDVYVVFTVARFESAQAAQQEASGIGGGSNAGNAAVGQLVTGSAVYVAIGADREMSKRLLVASSALSQTCVEENVTFQS